MISVLRQLRLDASIILLLIVGVCAAGGFFFAFYETEDADRPLAVVRHVSRDAGQIKPMVATENKTAIPTVSPSSGISQTVLPNEKSQEEQASSQEDR